MKHGAPGDDHRHVGDLGNIIADTNGVATLDMVDSVISLNGINNIIGRGVVIHAGEDDMGKVSSDENNRVIEQRPDNDQDLGCDATNQHLYLCSVLCTALLSDKRSFVV